MERKSKARAETGIYLVVVAAILIVANVISYRVYHRWDTTKNERYSLSKGSAHLVRDGLNKPMVLTLYVTRGLAKHDAFIQDLTDLLTEYERSAGKQCKEFVDNPDNPNGPKIETSVPCFKYTVVEPKTEDEKKAAKDDGMQEAHFGEGSKTGKEQALISKGFMGLSFKYGSEKEAIPMMSPEQSQGLEFWITNKIREIRDRADNKFQKIGILTGKDEIKLSEANLIAAQAVKGFSKEKEKGQTYYEAEMIVNGHSKDILIDANGAIVEVEEEVAMDTLPAEVKAGLQAKAGEGKLVKVETITKKDKLVAYEAQVTKGSKKSEVQVSPDGKPLDHEE